MVSEGRSILVRIAAGDAGAVALCVDEYGGMIAALAGRYLRPLGGDVDDAVQDVFIELWRCAGRYSPAAGSEASFVATVAHRRLIDRQRRLAGKARLTLAGNVPATLARAGAAAQGLPEDARRAAEAFDRLTPDEREAVWLTICNGYSHERASAALSAPLGTVKTRIRRALARMREFLAEDQASAPQAGVRRSSRSITR